MSSWGSHAVAPVKRVQRERLRNPAAPPSSCFARCPQIMTKIGAICLVTIGVWVAIELGVQFGHYGHQCKGGAGAAEAGWGPRSAGAGAPPALLLSAPASLGQPSASYTTPAVSVGQLMQSCPFFEKLSLVAARGW